MSSLLAALLLAADPSPIALHHTSGVSCPGQSWLEGNVTARLGFSPFSADSPVVAVTAADCTANGCQAQLELRAPGKPPRRRTLTGPAQECSELMESLALALALAIDPQLLSRPPPELPLPTPPPAPAPSVERERPSAPSPNAPIILVEAPKLPPPEFHFQGGLAGHGALGLSAYVTGGASVGIGFRVGWFGLLAEGRFDVPRSVELPAGQVSSSVLLGSLVPCGHYRGLGLCLLGSAGGLQVTGTVPGGQRNSSPLLLLGGRLAYEWMFSSWLGLQARLSIYGVVTRTTVVADGVAVWVTSQVAGDAALGAVVVF